MGSNIVGNQAGINKHRRTSGLFAGTGAVRNVKSSPWPGGEREKRRVTSTGTTYSGQEKDREKREREREEDEHRRKGVGDFSCNYYLLAP